MGFEGLCWAGCELHSCSLMPKLTAEEKQDRVICSPQLTITDGIWAQQVCDWQVSPQLLSADDKCYSHPILGLINIALSWVGLAVVQVLLVMAGLEWVSALEEPQEALSSPICTFCNWRVADQLWQKTDLKLLRENTQSRCPQTECLGTECKHVKE